MMLWVMAPTQFNFFVYLFERLFVCLFGLGHTHSWFVVSWLLVCLFFFVFLQIK